MYARLQSLMHWRMSLFLDGRHDDLAREYLYPVPIYLNGRQQVLRSASDMARSLHRLREMTASMGITRVEAKVCAIELPRNGRFRVWIAQRSLGSGGEVKATGQFVHYCRLTEHGIKTEMSDYPDCRGDWIASEPRRALG